MDSAQVTDWLQSQHRDRVSKMDKFFTDASHKRACILITCSRPDFVGHAVVRIASRDVALVSQSSLRTAVLPGISRVSAIRAGLFRRHSLVCPAGAENVRASISDWLCFMRLGPAWPNAELERCDERYL